MLIILVLRRRRKEQEAAVASESGFSFSTTFYRNFKTVTGKTPQEWKKSIV